MDREITYLTTKENYRDWGIQSFGWLRDLYYEDSRIISFPLLGPLLQTFIPFQIFNDISKKKKSILYYT